MYQVYKQKIKHLLYEHQNSISELRAEEAIKMKLAHDEFQTSESSLMAEKGKLKVEMKEQELSSEDIVKNLKLVCCKA